MPKGVYTRSPERLAQMREHGFQPGQSGINSRSFDRGPLSRAWKDDAGYHARHIWINRQNPRAGLCEFCAADDGRKTEYANISGEYRRNRDDWHELCVPCHKEFDDNVREENAGGHGRRSARTLSS